MKKSLKIVGFLFVASICIGLVLFIYTYYRPNSPYDIHLEELDCEKRSLSKEDYLEDFDFAYNTLKEHYPYFEVNKIKNNIDWLANKDLYRDYVGESSDDNDFYKRMNIVLSNLNNGHTHILGDQEALYYYISYYQMPRNDWRHELTKIYEKLE